LKIKNVRLIEGRRNAIVLMKIGLRMILWRKGEKQDFMSHRETAAQLRRRHMINNEYQTSTIFQPNPVMPSNTHIPIKETDPLVLQNKRHLQPRQNPLTKHSPQTTHKIPMPVHLTPNDKKRKTNYGRWDGLRYRYSYALYTGKG